jgi:hypothetical protein
VVTLSKSAAFTSRMARSLQTLIAAYPVSVAIPSQPPSARCKRQRSGTPTTSSPRAVCPGWVRFYIVAPFLLLLLTHVSVGTALQAGMVLALSIWDDHTANMLWLDSNYPLNKPVSTPGVARGTCASSSGEPKDVESQSGGASVVYSNIKWGDIGTTY